LQSYVVSRSALLSIAILLPFPTNLSESPRCLFLSD
jgi:hypothetical protein